MSGNEIQGALLDLDPGGREPPPPLTEAADARPGELEMLARGMAGLPRYPVRLLRSIPRALPNVDEVASLAGIPGVKTAGRLAARVESLRIEVMDAVAVPDGGYVRFTVRGTVRSTGRELAARNVESSMTTGYFKCATARLTQAAQRLVKWVAACVIRVTVHSLVRRFKMRA